MAIHMEKSARPGVGQFVALIEETQQQTMNKMPLSSSHLCIHIAKKVRKMRSS